DTDVARVVDDETHDTVVSCRGVVVVLAEYPEHAVTVVDVPQVREVRRDEDEARAVTCRAVREDTDAGAVARDVDVEPTDGRECPDTNATVTGDNQAVVGCRTGRAQVCGRIRSCSTTDIDKEA